MKIEEKLASRVLADVPPHVAAREAKEDLVTAAELWFEAIIGGRFAKIGPRQGELLAAIERYRQLKPKRRLR